MNRDERHLQELFHEMVKLSLESPNRDFDAKDAGVEEIEAMLHLARELRAWGREPMPDAQASLVRARERVLQSLPATPLLAAPQAQPAATSSPSRLWRFVSVPAMAWTPTVAMIILAAITFLAVTVSVSAGAMPGSPLYPIKRTTENLTLHIVPEDRRGVIEDAINRHRAEEIQYARERHIITRVPYEGVVQGCEGTRCRIGDFTVSAPPSVAAQLHPGDRVRVVIQVQPDKGLMILSVAPGRTPTPPLRVATAKPEGVIPASPTSASAPARAKPPRNPTSRPPQRSPAAQQATKTKGTLPKKPTRPPALPTVTLSRPVKASTAALPPLPPPRATATRPLPATPTPTPTPRSTPKRTPTPKKPGVGKSTPVPRGQRVTPSTARDRENTHARKTIRGRILRVYRARGRIVWILVGRTRIYITQKTTITGKIAKGREVIARTYVKNGRRYASRITVQTASGASTPQPTPERSGTQPPVRRP